MALKEFLPGLVVISGLRKTRKLDIKNIKSRYAIDLFFMIKFFKITFTFFNNRFSKLDVHKFFKLLNLKINTEDSAVQEEFNVVKKTLTVEEARAQTDAPYTRTILQSGRGKDALFPESLALLSNFPKQSAIQSYKIGASETKSLSRD